MFDPETMQILGGDQMATIAFTRELGLQARSGDSTSRTILKAGVIPDSSIAMLEDSDMEVLGKLFSILLKDVGLWDGRNIMGESIGR